MVHNHNDVAGILGAVNNLITKYNTIYFLSRKESEVTLY